MTPEQHQEFVRKVGNRLVEYFDGFALVGYHATNGDRIIISHAKDLKTLDALRTAMVTAAQPVAIDNGETGKV